MRNIDNFSAIAIIILFAMLFVLEIYRLIEQKTPRYMKPKNFFKMYDIETPIADGWEAESIKINHSYIKDANSMFFAEE